MPPLLIIITGLPCTGKTTLGERLAHQAGLLFFSKDIIKELLFEQVGWNDRQWSKKLSRASNAILLHIADKLLAVGASLILESNFDQSVDAPRLQQMAEQTSARMVQLYCTADPDVIVERFRQRVEKSTRHPGHVDAAYLPDLRQLVFSQADKPLDLTGTLIQLDTTKGEFDYAGLLAAIFS